MRQGARGFWQHLELPLPPILYHYTSLDNMMKIIESEELFVTDIHYLNDSREWQHARDMILDCATRLNDGAPAGDQSTALRWLIQYLKRQSVQNVYVASFSEEGDDLNQWRGYTRPGQGVCIGFASGALRELANSVQIHGASHYPAVFSALGKVIYAAPREDGTFEAVLRTAQNFMNIVDGEVVKSNFDLLVDQSAPFYKDVAFKNEAEWRISLVENTHIDLPLRQFFRSGSAMLIPYTKLSFNGRAGDLIKQLVVGPTPHNDLSKRSVDQFLVSRGLRDVKVDYSSVPFRGW